jgi:TonB family protein
MAALCISGGYAAWAAQPAQEKSNAPNTIRATGDTGSYPAAAAAAGVGGMVRVAVEVEADGTIRSLQVQSSEPAGVFDAAALEMAGKMKFTPAIKDGKPVARRVVVPIRFEPTAGKAQDATGN